MSAGGCEAELYDSSLFSGNEIVQVEIVGALYSVSASSKKRDQCVLSAKASKISQQPITGRDSEHPTAKPYKRMVKSQPTN